MSFYRFGRDHQFDQFSKISDRRLIYILTGDEDYEYDYEDKADYKKKKPSYKEEYNEKYDFSVETFITSKFNTFFNLIILGGILLLPMAVAAELNLEAISAQIQALTDLLTEYYVVLNNQLASVITTLADIVTSIAALTTSVTGITTTLTGITTTLTGITTSLTGITTSLTNIQTRLTAIQAAIAGIGKIEISKNRLDSVSVKIGNTLLVPTDISSLL